MQKAEAALGVKGFITFEGIEGSGKSTQIKLLSDFLKSKGRDVLTTAEPGGTDIGLKIRRLLLEPENHMDPLTELLLYNAARAEHVRKLIYPSLLQGSVVICDRFADSTMAYQGYGRGMDMSVITTLNDVVIPELKPFITFLLDMDVEAGLRRNIGAGKEDRFELETIEFHQRVRHGYLVMAKEEPGRIKLIEASGSVEDVHRKIIEALISVQNRTWGLNTP
ncbi:MAG: dTMP kinase [Nitrospirae bacterium]|nr:dTMP kinase [Nitrospirota bacterium]